MSKPLQSLSQFQQKSCWPPCPHITAHRAFAALSDDHGSNPPDGYSRCRMIWHIWMTCSTGPVRQRRWDLRSPGSGRRGTARSAAGNGAWEQAATATGARRAMGCPPPDEKNA